MKQQVDVDLKLTLWIDGRRRRLWNYLFGQEWTHTDNTPKGAAQRIRYVVKNGLPKYSNAEMKGDAALSYH